jgi:hypothetical protein
MSSTQAPDPREFASWEDAFQYPIPVVRRLEQQLRSNINENSDKLRDLVGSSYRDLLGTAERIVEMNSQIHSVDSRLGDIGQKCNARAIETIVANHQKTAKAHKHRSVARNLLASNIALLQRCMNQTSRIIKRGGSALRAAKLLVLARLLFTNASKAPDPPTLLDTLKSNLTSLRRRLLSHIDKTLSLADLETSVLVETLAAFSLATTSTPTDVLNHLLHVRTSALSHHLDMPLDHHGLRSLSLITATIKHVQAIFPKQLATLLGKLQDEPLLQDTAIRNIPELNLEIYERWIADDVRNFTPWLRHDQLQAPAASAVLKKWVAQARATFLESIRLLLKDLSEAPNIISYRKRLLSRSLSADRKLPGLDPSNFFQELRTIINDSLQGFVETAAGRVHVIIVTYLVDWRMLTVADHHRSTGGYRPEEAITPVQSDEEGGSNGGEVSGWQATDLWDPENLDIAPGKGSINFRTTIYNASQGKGAAMQSLVDSLSKWSSEMAILSNTIKSMRDDRWNDDLDLDIEDDFEIDSPQDLLGKEDPDELQKLFVSEKDKSLTAVYKSIQLAASAEHYHAPTLLRVLREVGLQASKGVDQTFTSKPPASLLETLHERLADYIVAKSTERTKDSSNGSRLFVRSPPTAIWEGTPPLPVQPSTACFRYLHETCRIMKEEGIDLWSPSAVSILKSKLREAVLNSLNNFLSNQGQLNGSDTVQHHIPKEEGAESSAESPEEDDPAAVNTESKTCLHSNTVQSPKLIQACFDLMYFDRMLTISVDTHAVVSFNTCIKSLTEKLEMENNTIERLRKNSIDYYKRTYILFGLLAV